MCIRDSLYKALVSDDEQYSLSVRFKDQYKMDSSESFQLQIIGLLPTMRIEIKSKVAISELAKATKYEPVTLPSNFPEVCPAYILFITLPVTTATVERSLSKLHT